MDQDPSEIPETPLSVAALLRKIETGWRPRYLCFWGHRAKSGRAAGPHMLSQWWQSEFEAGGVRYATAEHYMMAEKARLFGDDGTCARILAAPSPGAAKALGREVKNFAEAEWEAHRFDIVVRGNAGKFGAERGTADLSLAHGRKGSCRSESRGPDLGRECRRGRPPCGKPGPLAGANLLGFALMKVRAILLAAA